MTRKTLYAVGKHTGQVFTRTTHKEYSHALVMVCCDEQGKKYEGCLTWCGRPDLAEKQLKSHMKMVGDKATRGHITGFYLAEVTDEKPASTENTEKSPEKDTQDSQSCATETGVETAENKQYERSHTGQTPSGMTYKTDANGVVIYKQCSHCLSLKRIQDFPKQPKGFGGAESNCKKCKSEVDIFNKFARGLDAEIATVCTD